MGVGRARQWSEGEVRASAGWLVGVARGTPSSTQRLEAGGDNGTDCGLGERARFFCPTTVHPSPWSSFVSWSLLTLVSVIIRGSFGNSAFSIVRCRFQFDSNVSCCQLFSTSPAYVRGKEFSALTVTTHYSQLDTQLRASAVISASSWQPYLAAANCGWQPQATLG